MKKAYTAPIIILCTLLCLPMFSSTTDAITGNFAADSTPYVGVVVLFSDAARTQPVGYCSGFLLSPTIMVTAGHSLIDVEAASICFDEGPISYAIENKEIIYYGTDTVYNGTVVPYPQYNPTLTGNQEFATNDIGLIVLDQQVEGITAFPTLPQAGFADTLAAKTDLRIVGYGVQYQVTPRNNGGMNAWIGTVTRNSAQVQLLTANFEGSDRYLKLTANTAQGKGAATFGDSGGPVIYNSEGEDIVLAVNAFVSSVNCRGVSYHTRVDTQQVLDWISEYLA